MSNDVSFTGACDDALSDDVLEGALAGAPASELLPASLFLENGDDESSASVGTPRSYTDSRTKAPAERTDLTIRMLARERTSTASPTQPGLAGVSALGSYPIIVHCHLRWDWVWQRPQQFLTRLAQRHPVLFVHGPLVEDGDFEPYSKLSQAEGFPNITLMESVFPREKFFSDGAWVDAERTRLVRQVLEGPLRGKFDSPVQWFYDPMAATSFLGQMNEVANVYDCMDQLSQFKFAPPALVERERVLLEAADVVFAGGRKMWEDKKKHNANAHFFGCGVDVEHFASARSHDTAVPEELSAIDGPVLGYFGVVDERMDYELVAKIADAHPEWTLAIVGPVCKVDPAQLPQRPNILWLGGRDYSQLPAYTKGFDVCLMPFALNEATEYINPTKALEYMATGRPIVSSAVPDVVSNFAEAVHIARSPEEFLALCEAALSSPERERIKAGLAMAGRNTWDSITAQLEARIADALCAKAPQRARAARVAAGT